jgi:2-polyprenyl-3-methyl-5-hydroxy-6-metoxy-1,4-benzoquinol methylase
MMAYREFVSLVHKSTKRDYQARVTQRDKADVAEMAVKFDYDYWDGSRETGYGGYKYDGRWRKVADAMVAAYGIKPGMRVLDVGSGKGFLLHDFRESVPGLEVAGIDISAYGIAHTMEDVKSFCGAKYICVEAYRNEREKVNLMYWQLTCRAFHTPKEWDFVFKQSGYTGDHEFIFFD